MPKGHVEPGEALEAAAVREVREETGWTARPTSFLTATTYDTDEGQKYVLYWNMDAISEEATPTRGEVLSCEWLTFKQACKKLTYPREREIVAGLAAGPQARAPRRARHTFGDPQRERLDEAVQLTWLRLAASHDMSAQAPRWITKAREALDQATEALSNGAIDRGWALVNLVHELEVASYDDVAVMAEAVAVRAEVSSAKFSGWRQLSILSLLDPVMRRDAQGVPVLDLAERRRWLADALRNRNEVYANEYRNVAIVRRYQAILLSIAMVILVATLVGAAFTNPRFETGAHAWWAAAAAALSGALGGITSALQRTTRRSVERIPERLGSLASSLSRPAIGAIAGVTVFLAVRAGVTQTATQQQVAYLLLLAFGAGFTERLVVRDPRDEAADRTARVVPPLPQTAAAAPPPATPPPATGPGGNDTPGPPDPGNPHDLQTTPPPGAATGADADAPTRTP